MRRASAMSFALIVTLPGGADVSALRRVWCSGWQGTVFNCASTNFDQMTCVALTTSDSTRTVDYMRIVLNLIHCAVDIKCFLFARKVAVSRKRAYHYVSHQRWC